MKKWGLVATTSPMGALKWLPEYTPHFAQKKVIILPDNDVPGRAHAAQVAAALLPVATSVRLVQLPDLPENGDVTDWVHAGGTLKQLKKLWRAEPRLGEARLSELKNSWGLKDKQAFPFRITEEGIFFQREDGEAIKVASRVDIVAQTRDAKGSNWGRLLEWHDKESRLHSWPMPMELLASDAGAVRARLFHDGVSFITTNARYRERLNEYLQTAPVDRTLRCVERIGWDDRAYVLPDKVIGTANSEGTLYQSPHDAGHHWKVRGTALEWRERVGRRCRGNSRLILAVCCGFAGPLLKLMAAESGGLHFYGRTSTGKTTALIVGASVCGGGGQLGFVQTWRTTINGLEAMAETHNDATLFLDELSQVDAHIAGETAYLLGNGMGKARMTRNMGMRRKLTWKLLYMSAGELTLAEHAASAGKYTRGGAEVRLLNIDADARKGWGLFEDLHGAAGPDAFCRDIRQAALSYYGAPFRDFVARVTRSHRRVKRFVQKFRKRFIKRVVPKDATGEVLRAADRFALLGAAGELATRWELTGWERGEAKRVAGRLFRRWLEKRGTKGSSDMHKAIQQVRAFLQIHRSRFEKLGSDNKVPIRDRVGFLLVDDEEGESEYRIFPAVFRDEVCKGHSSDAVQKALYEAGYLIRREPPNYTNKPRLPGLGTSQRVYCIRATILEGDE